MSSGGEIVLVVDNDPAVAQFLTAALQRGGYRVAVAATGHDAVDIAATQYPAVVIVDPLLDDMDGFELCRLLRQWSRAPIVVLAADDAVDRKIVALDNGADDYITKPFSLPELLARVRVAIRHSRALGAADGDAVFEVGDLRVDSGRHVVSQGGRGIELTPKEFAFLELLVRHQGRVLAHRVILRHVWGPCAEGRTEYLRTYANLLRKKLDHAPGSPRLITEPAVGYRLAQPQ